MESPKIAYDLRVIESDDLAPLVDFTLRHTGESHGGRETMLAYWQWKFLRNPLGRGILIVAEQDGRLLGTISSTIRQVEHQGRTWLCAEMGDILVDPTCRRMGIFSALARKLCDEAFARGLPLMFVRPNNRSFPGLLKLGFRDMFKIENYYKLLRTGPYVGARYGRVLQVAGAPLFAAADRLVFRNDGGDAGGGMVVADPPPAARVERGFGPFVKDGAYLRWRYFDPGSPYLVLRHPPTGMEMVFKLESHRGGSRAALWVDLLAAPANHESWPGVVQQACRYLRRTAGADILHLAVRMNARLRVPLEEALRRNGFRRRRHFLNFAILLHPAHAAEFHDLLLQDPWAVFPGDTDSV